MKLWSLFLIITAFLASALTACNYQASQPAGHNQNESLSACDRIQKNITEAQSIALELKHFDWSEFSDVGILYPPSGVCPVGELPVVERSSVEPELRPRVVGLLDGLPSPTTAETYSLQCGNSLKLAGVLCSGNFAESVPASENVTASWLQACAQLESALQGAEYLASRDRSIVADYALPKVFADFTVSDEKIKQKYLEKFTARTDEYIRLYDEFIRNMQDARQTVIDLSNGPLPGFP